jgi:hypothetical protein
MLSGMEEEVCNMGECSFFYYYNIDKEIISFERATTTRTKMTMTLVALSGGGGTASINWPRTCAPSSPCRGMPRPT